jgi:hypothetical protein
VGVDSDHGSSKAGWVVTVEFGCISQYMPPARGAMYSMYVRHLLSQQIVDYNYITTSYCMYVLDQQLYCACIILIVVDLVLACFRVGVDSFIRIMVAVLYEYYNSTLYDLARSLHGMRSERNKK